MQLKKFLLFGLIAAVLPAFAEEVADRKTATSLKYVEHELSTRQNKFTAEANKAMEYTDSAGIVQQRTVKSDLGTNTSDTSLPMVGGVNTKLATKQDDIAPINDHTAVTYTGQPGGIGRKGIYQTTGTYAEQSDNLIDAKTFNAALKNGLDSEFKCREDNLDPASNLCWLWEIHNPTNETIEIHGKNLFNPNNLPTFTGDLGYIVGHQPEPISDGFKVTLAIATNTTYNYYLYLPIEEGYVYSCEAPSGGRFEILNGKWAFVYSRRGNGGLPAGTVIEFHKVQLERGDTATAYEPYVGETVNVYLPQNQ